VIFEDYSLDVGRRELRRRSDIVAVEPQVLDLLHYLVRSRDRVVSKDDLIANVWNGRIVSDSTLTSRIASARHAIGDNGEAQRLIRTIPRKGLRFVADVRERPAAHDGGDAGLLLHIAGAETAQSPPAVAVPRLPDKPSIAVLPFTNMSGDSDQDYFADGITEDIVTALSRIRWLFVIARNSSFRYKGHAVDVKQVAQELGVRYLLEGSVRKLGNRVRITAQLVDALTGAHHWAERYDRDLVDIFALQDEITRSVAAAIEPRLLAVEGIRSQARAQADLDAWDLVARAMARYWRATGPDVEAAIVALKDAVARHPDYGPAHSMLAFCLVLAGHFGWLPLFEVPKVALESARRAVELDDNDPWAYLALGYVAFVDGQTDEAAAQYHRAIDLNPNFAAAHGYWGYALAFDGRSAEAVEKLLLAMRMSPYDRQNSIYMGGIAVAHYLAGRYDLAIEWARKGVQQGPSMTAPHRILCASLAQTGRLHEARVVLERVREMQPYISIAWVTRMVPYTARTMPHFLDGLAKAGLT
jgi:TolB-like protein